METCDGLARLLEYPGEGYIETTLRCLETMRLADAEAASCLEAFAGTVRNLSTEQLQELFIQTFDLNPACVLEVGWQLFGDDYKRGEFLVRMREELRAHELAESGELPDHLTHVLRLVARMEAEEAGAFASLFVLPAVEKMLAGLSGKHNPFENILLAIRCLLSRRVSAAQEVKRA